MDKSYCLDVVRRHAPDQGAQETPIEGLSLFRANEPSPPAPGVYPICVCIILQGEKQATLEDGMFIYDAKHYLCSSIPMPIQASIVRASKSKPLLGLMLQLDTPVMQDLALRLEHSGVLPPSDHETSLGLCAARWSEDFAFALSRLLALLDEPALVPVIGEARLQELMLAIFRGDAGPSMRHYDGRTREIGKAIAHIRKHPTQDISIDDLARECGMSRAAFHKKFKATTGYAPLQFIKALRLNQAAVMIRMGRSVGEAAVESGYSSNSQFSREFRRHFGTSPRDWATKSRETTD